MMEIRFIDRKTGADMGTKELLLAMPLAYVEQFAAYYGYDMEIVSVSR